MEATKIAHIIDVNRQNPIGSLVGQYGDDRYWQGVRHGLIAGIFLGGFSAIVGMFRN